MTPTILSSELQYAWQQAVSSARLLVANDRGEVDLSATETNALTESGLLHIARLFAQMGRLDEATLINRVLTSVAPVMSEHPGDWPDREALEVIAAYFGLDAPGFDPYEPKAAAPEVRALRAILRSELNW